MSGNIAISNRQQLRPIRISFVRAAARSLLRDELRLTDYQLGLYIVDDREMTFLNETHLCHAGSTDVITFDYADPDSLDQVSGEIFVCVPEAVRQAIRFEVPWEQELIRYVIHGVLHLCGFDDDTAAARKTMKRVENKLVRVLDSRLDFRSVSHVIASRQRAVRKR